MLETCQSLSCFNFSTACTLAASNTLRSGFCSNAVTLAGNLGIDVNVLPRVTYFKMRDANEYGARNNAGRDASANANIGFVVSPLPFDEHELLHTITLGAWGYSAPFLEEGIAVALSCEMRLRTSG